MDKFLDKIFFRSRNLDYINQNIVNLTNQTPANKIFEALNNYSDDSEVRYVGGCIRKIIKKEIVDDIDLATNLTPDEVSDALKKNEINFYETGVEHGTVTAIMDEYKYEITSLRKDVATDGRHAMVEFSKDWKEDATRRDFSINSIYSDKEGNLFDPFDGKKDLENGSINFIGEAENRIKEDYLRILRYIRFFLNYSKHNHDPKIIKIIKKNIKGVAKISSERLLDEFKKLIKSKGFLKLFKDSFSEEIIKLIFPQFKHFHRFKKLNKFSEQKLFEVDFIFLISLMIIDETDNVDYFIYKFNLSNADKKRILFLKKFYDENNKNNFFSEKKLYKIFYFNGKECINDLLYFELFRSKNINKKIIYLIDFFKNKEVPIFPIKGKNIIEKYNYSEGKLLGEKLKKIEEKWIDNNFKVSEKEVEQLLKN